jgi:hypothetical protein
MAPDAGRSYGIKRLASRREALFYCGWRNRRDDERFAPFRFKSLRKFVQTR